MKNYIEEINKMNKETCLEILRKASTLNGKETFKQIEKIYGRCLDIQGLIVLNLIKNGN